MTLTEEQWRVIENLLGILAGAGSSIGIQWIAKRKTKTEVKDTHTENVLKGSDALVEATQEVVSMLQKILEDERKNFRVEIERVKIACNQQITQLKEDHDNLLEGLRDDNNVLSTRVTRLIDENKILVANNKSLNNKIIALKERLRKYETDLNDTGDHKNIKPPKKDI